jgi:hypothetical protein
VPVEKPLCLYQTPTVNELTRPDPAGFCLHPDRQILPGFWNITYFSQMRYLSPASLFGEPIQHPIDKKAIQLRRKKLFAEMELYRTSTIVPL